MSVDYRPICKLKLVLSSSSPLTENCNWLALNFKMSKILMFVGILLMVGKASSHYNKSYNGYTLILPHDDVMDHSNTKPLELSFSDAQRWCVENVTGSTLATIPNRYVQQNITDFIESVWQNRRQLRSSNFDNIRLNGKLHITNEWRWVNGRPKAEDITVREQPEDSSYSFYARLVGKICNIYPNSQRSPCFTICEYPGNSEQCDLSLNGRCYQKKQDWLNWYEARNGCLDGGGDLASLETLNVMNICVSLKNLSLWENSVYCIGLQKNDWRWEDAGSTIKYTNWEKQQPSKYNSPCLCITKYKGEWKECDCSEQFPFICMIRDMPDSATVRPTERTSTSTETIQFVILVVSCALVFVVIIIIAAAFIAKKRGNSETPRALSSSGYVTPKHVVTESSTDFPVYEEIIQNPKETNIPASDTTYASVVRKTVEKTEEGHPVNSIVYAELDLTPKE